MTYTVSTVTRSGEIAVLGRFCDKAKAMCAAKRAAHTRTDCQTYGPTSLAYVGREVTAVVAWS